MKLLIAVLWSVLALALAAPALAQAGPGDEKATSPASRDQYDGEIPTSESAAGAARFAVSQASDASKAFEQARAAAKSAGVDDETAAALAAEAVAAHSEGGENEGGSARAAPEGRLPDTGGASLLAVGALAVLIGGLVVGRASR